VAPEAKLVVVIPRTQFVPGEHFSIGYSIGHHLALTYIKEMAQRVHLPVVINVSQGTNAGAHDGRSYLEIGFDLITGNGRDPGIVIVKSAGNERDKRIHAHLTLPKFSLDSLKWESRTRADGSPIPRFSDLIELWFTSSDGFEFRLRNPKGEHSQVINVANRNTRGHFSSGNAYEMTLTSLHPDNGDSRLLISITAGTVQSIASGTRNQKHGH
jgi:endonuclease G